MVTPITEILKKNKNVFIPIGTDFIDTQGNIHTTLSDQWISQKKFGIITDLGVFIPNSFIWTNLAC